MKSSRMLTELNCANSQNDKLDSDIITYYYSHGSLRVKKRIFDLIMLRRTATSLLSGPDLFKLLINYLEISARVDSNYEFNENCRFFLSELRESKITQANSQYLLQLFISFIDLIMFQEVDNNVNRGTTVIEYLIRVFPEAIDNEDYHFSDPFKDLIRRLKTSYDSV